MTVYDGIVKGNRVVLPKGIELPDGVHVTVHVPASSEVRRMQLKQKLIAHGLLLPRATSAHPSDTTYTPVTLPDKPVSETLIEERR